MFPNLQAMREWFLSSSTVAILMATTFGCGSSSHPQFSSNSVHAARLSLEIGEPVSEEGLIEVNRRLERMFGTPNSPNLPDSVPEYLVSLDNIRRAAGPVYSDENDVHFGLYRKHCVRCHGVTGDGLGPAAKLLDPYPRDFRLGKFKYKSTPIGTKPTRSDLSRILKNGIPGTAMPSFSTLKDQDVEALVDYVIYLSVRGETERELLGQLAHDFDNNASAWIAEWNSASQKDTVSWAVEDESKSLDGPSSETGMDPLLRHLVYRNYMKWNVPVPEAPRRPSGIPILDLPREATKLAVAKQSSDAMERELSDSIDRGLELFRGQAAGCSQCHGPNGEGWAKVRDGLHNRDYDDWTKDWTIVAGISPEDRSSLQPLLKAGALKPTPIASRNLQYGVFRGGSHPEDIFHRIVHGIEGTPMPAAALQPEVSGGLTSSQVWDLVNYCLHLKK